MNAIPPRSRLGLNRRILLQVSAPAVLISLLLFAVCLVSAWHANRLQSNLSEVLARDVKSMQAAYQLEIHMRKVRFRHFLYLMEPNPDLKEKIIEAETGFEEWQKRAQQVAQTPAEQEALHHVQAAYPSAKLSADERGMTLSNSPPPVPTRNAAPKLK